jgi:hypothetical protein
MYYYILMSDYTLQQITSNKLKSSYPQYAINAIKLLSINKNKMSLVGSYSFALPQFPSDIDIREIIEGGTFDGTIKYFIKALQHKVMELQNTKNVWISDIKIGIDDRYNFTTYDDDYIDRIYLLEKNKLLSKEYIELIDGNTDENINTLLESLSKIRWSVQEILSETKTLIGGVTIRLYDAIKSQSVINMEIFAIVNNKITDMSNFFALIYHDENGVLQSINLPNESIEDFPSFFEKEIKMNIVKMYYSSEPDYGKIIKRLFSLGKFTNDESLVDHVYKYINSITALAGQKKSEISLIIKFIELTQLHGIPIDILVNQLSTIKFQIANLINMPVSTVEIINNILDRTINEILQQTNIDTIIEKLSYVKEILSDYVSYNAKKYLENNKLDKYINKMINSLN